MWLSGKNACLTYEALDSMPALSVMTLSHTQNLSAGFLVLEPPTILLLP